MARMMRKKYIYVDVRVTFTGDNDDMKGLHECDHATVTHYCRRSLSEARRSEWSGDDVWIPDTQYNLFTIRVLDVGWLI
jgi:hypothetical protein